MYYTDCLISTSPDNFFDNCGLLFSSNDAAAIKHICLAPEIHRLFPGYFVERYSQGILLYGYGAVTLLEDILADGAPLWFCYNYSAFQIDLHAGYNRCLSLFKAVGCISCPDHTYACLQRILSVTVPDVPFTYPTWELNLLANGPTLASHTYVSPALTAPKHIRADNAWRHFTEHGFTKVRSLCTTQNA